MGDDFDAAREFRKFFIGELALGDFPEREVEL